MSVNHYFVSDEWNMVYTLTWHFLEVSMNIFLIFDQDHHARLPNFPILFPSPTLQRRNTSVKWDTKGTEKINKSLFK